VQITGFIWQEESEDKIISKHGITPDEAEQVFFNRPRFWFVEKGYTQGEDVYAALGQTGGGRYVIVYFIHKRTEEALIISAREMTAKERRRYGRK
jgi:uncharacterized DUF497 family protein